MYTVCTVLDAGAQGGAPNHIRGSVYPRIGRPRGHRGQAGSWSLSCAYFVAGAGLLSRSGRGVEGSKWKMREEERSQKPKKKPKPKPKHKQKQK